MIVIGGNHVVARGDGNRPEAISTGKCSKREGEGGYETRPYDMVAKPTRGGGFVVAELVSAFGGEERS